VVLVAWLLVEILRAEGRRDRRIYAVYLLVVLNYAAIEVSAPNWAFVVLMALLVALVAWHFIELRRGA
jgi:hypothetical protein